MTIIVVFILVTLLCLSRKRSLIQIAIFLLAILFAFRNDMVPDAKVYRMYYYGQDSASLEQGYLSLTAFFHQYLNFPFEAFLFIISLVLLEIWYWSTKKISTIGDVGYQLPLMLSYMGFYFYGVVIRSAIAITICYSLFPLLLYSKKKYKIVIFLIGVLLAIQFHQTSILYALIPLFLLRINNKALTVINIISLLILLTNEIVPIQDYMNNVIETLQFYRFNSYLDIDPEAERVSIISYYFLIVSFLAVFFKDKLSFVNEKERYTYSFFVNLTVFGTLLFCLVCQIPVMTRLSMQWLFFISYVFYMILFRSSIKFVRTNKTAIALLVCAIQLFALLHYYPLIMNY